jgi:hypothetical protein
MARASLPEGLLDRVEIGADLDWSIHLARIAESDAEVELVHRTVRQALAQLRNHGAETISGGAAPLHDPRGALRWDTKRVPSTTSHSCVVTPKLALVRW